MKHELSQNTDENQEDGQEPGDEINITGEEVDANDDAKDETLNNDSADEHVGRENETPESDEGDEMNDIDGMQELEGEDLESSGEISDMDAEPESEELDQDFMQDSGGAVSEQDEEREFLRNQMEAVLFVSGKAISAEEISVKLGISKLLIEELLEELAFAYLERSTSLEIAKVGEKYILQMKPEFTDHVKKFASGGLIREAVMRTLTIIAAKQPILQSKLSKLRSGAGEHIRDMLDMDLIRRVKKGRSYLITTTDKFADMFGLSRNVEMMKEQIKTFLMSQED